jgi:23S rRNA pseudouridine2605 synthase
VQERLQKVLSRAGIASRRAAERLMAEGRVTVNGNVVRELGTKADPETDEVRVDGSRVKLPREHVYLVLYKPKGAITTRHDPAGRATVMDLVPHISGLFPVGRLDVTTEGLLLLTNDGAFAERVAHPRYEVPRIYHAKVRGLPDAQTLTRLQRGVVVEGDRLAADRVRILEAGNNSWLEVTLHEGKQHEVKRLLDAVGHPVSKLKRVSIGPITDRGLAPGQFRALTPAEIKGVLAGRGAPSRQYDRPRRSPSRPPPAPAPVRPGANDRRGEEGPSGPAPGARRSASGSKRPASAGGGEGRTPPPRFPPSRRPPRPGAPSRRPSRPARNR